MCSTSLLVNMEICMNIPAVCYFDSTTLSCKAAKLTTTIKCSSLISTSLHYNKLSCSSISNTITDPFAAGKKACIKDPAAVDLA